MAQREALNGLRQFDAALQVIETATKAGGAFSLRPSLVCSLNRLAIEGLKPNPGVYRAVPITISNTPHVPPDADQVGVLVEEMCDYVNNGTALSPIHIAAYLLWRLNWIHPFEDGNGRTSRIISYIMLCVRLGFVLPGKNTIPEQIAADKNAGYYSGLDAADAAFKRGDIDVSDLETLLGAMLAKQLVSVHEAACLPPDEPKG